MKSVFMDKAVLPDDADLKRELRDTFPLWESLAGFTHEISPSAEGRWHFSGDKYGWSYRISDSKRVLIYLLPRAGFFKVAFVFGPKATDAVLESGIADSIKNELKAAKPYAEGRGIRLEVKADRLLDDIYTLIEIKVAH